MKMAAAIEPPRLPMPPTTTTMKAFNTQSSPMVWLTPAIGEYKTPLTTAMAAASGGLFATIAGVSPTMGLDWVLKAFIVVVVGGMGNLGGSIAAAIFISLLESYASIWVNPSQAVSYTHLRT